MIAYERLTVLEQALASGKRHYQIKGFPKPDYLERMKRNPREAEDFTQMLFYLHQGDAEALASFEQAPSINSYYVEGLVNRGLALAALSIFRSTANCWMSRAAPV